MTESRTFCLYKSMIDTGMDFYRQTKDQKILHRIDRKLSTAHILSEEELKDLQMYFGLIKSVVDPKLD